MTRFGVIGCGTMSYWTHLRLLPRIAGVELVAISDPDAAALDRARTIVSARPYADTAELLDASDVDAVVIASPTGHHAEAAVAAVRSGRHVYLEKPIASSLDEATRVAEVSRSANVRTAVGLHRRLHPAFERARALLARGAIGTVREVQTVFAEPFAVGAMPAWKARRATGGGALLDLGVHHFDLVRWLLGRELRVVSSTIESRSSEHDFAAVHLQSDGGVAVQSLVTFASGPADTIELFGERGSLRVDRHRARLELRGPRRFGYGTRRRVMPWRPGGLRWRLRKLVRPSFEPSVGRALARFVRVLVEGEGARGDLASMDDGLRANALVAQAEDLAARGEG